MSIDDAVRLESLTKTYGAGDSAVVALREIQLSFPRGSFTAVMGPSGSGKSTLLQCAAGLDRPTSGRVFIDGRDIIGLNETQLTELRRELTGFIFQSFNLLPSLTAEQNVSLPLRLAGIKPDRAAVLRALGQMGIDQKAGELYQPALWRPAAARRHCSCPGDPSRRDFRGRADRRPRPQHGSGTARRPAASGRSTAGPGLWNASRRSRAAWTERVR